jgi:hypothetical protein
MECHCSKEEITRTQIPPSLIKLKNKGLCMLHNGIQMCVSNPQVNASISMYKSSWQVKNRNFPASCHINQALFILETRVAFTKTANQSEFMIYRADLVA